MIHMKKYIFIILFVVLSFYSLPPYMGQTTWGMDQQQQKMQVSRKNPSLFPWLIRERRSPSEMVII